MDRREELVQVGRLARCVKKLIMSKSTTSESYVQGVMFLAQYRIDVENMKIYKQVRGGKPIVADDFVFKPNIYSELVHKAYMLSFIYQNSRCDIPFVDFIASTTPAQTLESIHTILCLIFDKSCEEVKDRPFETVAKEAGFEIIPQEVP